MRPIIFLLIFGAIGYVLYAIWPTPYSLSKRDNSVIRTNRITGAEDVRTKSGWKSLEKTMKVRPGDRYNEEVGVKNAVN
jgi:hypothetical protein